MVGNKVSAGIYLSYYDSSAKVIKYRYGRVTGSGSVPTFSLDFGGNSSNSTGNSGAFSYPCFDTIADSNSSGAYTCVAVSDNGSSAIVLWYDSKARTLKARVSSNANAVSGNPAWGTPLAIDDDDAGQYVDSEVASNGSIHIAYYSSARGDLRYAYLDSFSDTVADVYDVDSYLAVGLYIDLELIGGKPYISYYNSSYVATSQSVKLAYQSSVVLGNGVISDKFTGAWNVMTLPVENIPKGFKVSIGVASGKPLVDFATDVALEWATKR